MTRDDGGPAFPFTCQGPTTGPETYYGMSLRDYFAGQALAGSLADPNCLPGSSEGGQTEEGLAQFCYRLADAMLLERAK